MGRQELKLISIFFRFFPLILLFACPIAHAQTPCGLAIPTPGNITSFPGVPTSYTSWYNPGPNYNTITMPVGTAIPDPDRGCIIYRLTKGDTPTPTMWIHAYKYASVSCTDDLDLVGSPDIGSWQILNVPAGSMYRANPSMQGNNDSQPLWAHCGHGNDAVDGRTLYWHDAGGPKIHMYRADTDADTVLHDFSQAGETACGGGTCTQVCWGCSSNGPHNGFPGNTDDTIIISATGSNGHGYGFVYDLRNNRIWPGFKPVDAGTGNTLPPGNSFPDHHLFLWKVGLYDATGTLLSVPSAGLTAQHNEEGLNSLGHDAVYFWGYSSGFTDCPNGPGIEEYDLVTNTHFCVADTGWGGYHVSVTQDGKWLAIGEYNSYGGSEACTNAYLNANPSLNWQANFTSWIGTDPSHIEGEVVLVKTDGSTAYRQAFHRSRTKDNTSCNASVDTSVGSYDYWVTPRIAVSYSGKYISFVSNMGFGSLAVKHAYADEYVLATGLGSGTSTAPAPPTGLTAIVH